MAELVLLLLIYVACVYAAQGYLYVPPKAIRKLRFHKTCKSMPNGNALCNGVEVEFAYTSVKAPEKSPDTVEITIESGK